MTSGICAAGSMFISARTERIAEIEIDDPADLRFRRRIVEAVVLWPGRERQHGRALTPCQP